MACSLIVPLATACNEKDEGPKSTYTFVYNVNYEGGRNRTITVGAGKTASKWNTSRAGYILDGWFEEKACTNEYNFASPVNKDTTIYALWTNKSSIVYHDVSFAYGNDLIKTQSCREGKPIESYSVMKSQKLGYEIDGWYLDENYSEEFVLDVDLVQGPMTLYAKYVQMEGVEYTEDGDFNFEKNANIHNCKY